MNRAETLFNKSLGKAISTVGTILPDSIVPELGISEKFSGNTIPVDATYGTTQPGDPYNTQGAIVGTQPTGYDQTGTTSSTGSTYTTQPAYNSADLAYLDDQANRLRAMLASTGVNLQNGLTGLGDSYNKAVSTANDSRGKALRDYGIQRDDTTAAKQSALGTVDTNSRTLANSLRRILGMASGSDSSAYQLAGPNAISRQASGQRTNVVDAYGKNFRDLDTAENDATSSFDNLLRDLSEQKGQRESELRAGVYGKEQELNSGLADIAAERQKLLGGSYGDTRIAQQPYEQAINQRQTDIDNLFAQFRTPYEVKPVTVNTPSLRDYTVDKVGINNGGQTQQSTYSNFLKKKLQEQNV